MENKVEHDWSWRLMDFLVRNSFGILCWLSGLTYQIYQMTGKTKRLTRAQCIMSVALWALSGITVVIALNGIEMNRLVYGFVCWATPIAIKPFADKLAEKAPQLSEKTIGAIESFFTSKKKAE